MTRVVITGMGAITPVGNDVNTFWENMKAGESGAGPISIFDASDYGIRIACEVKDFNPADWMDKREARRVSRCTQFAIATTRQALADANFEVTPDNSKRVGVVINSGGGGLSTMEEATQKLLESGPRAVSPFLITAIMLNAVSSMVSIELGTMGPVVSSALACASGSYALLEAYHLIKRGEADLIISGGTEAAISPVIFASFARMGALSADNDLAKNASRPFDKDRNGFVFGEGAAVFILESEEHAKARGARIYGEILGGSLTADGHHVTAPKPDASGTSEAIRRAIAYSGKSPDDVGAVFAHATSTPLGDAAETLAIKQVFGERAYQVPVTATKSQVGHMLGAAGAVSVLAAVKTMQDGIICPTINYQTPDPECDLDYVPNEARPENIDLALVHAFGFGGHNVVVAVGKYSENGKNGKS
ncbi:MAG TPA: beta-ketoacyl-ACP synthase II [Anaerolineae bacterium]|nr:beta-ketoacyl-ACP synthase II [Anaerolineae bacterium]HMR64540.1 beta-ketoacyl-ACP synthase II [Anaerolineae bacterium]